MVPPDHRGGDRTSYYTMKTTSRGPSSHATLHGQTQNHAHSNSQAFFANKVSSSPASSPKYPSPYLAGQSLPPTLSPSTNRLAQSGRAPSPNYFGLAVEQTNETRESSGVARENWSPSSSVKSFGAALAKQLPLDASSGFEAFKRQVDVNQAKLPFGLSTSQFGFDASTPLVSTPSAAQRARSPRCCLSGANVPDVPSFRFPGVAGSSHARPKDEAGKTDSDANTLHDVGHVSRDSKRGFEGSSNLPFSLPGTRHESPARLEVPSPACEHCSAISKVDDRHPRLSMITSKADPPPPDLQITTKAGIVPAHLDAGSPAMIQPFILKKIIESTPDDQFLLLDMRVSPQFGQARIKGALNLCIPTTLLKRATFNLQRLQSTFQSGEDQQKFAHWRDAKYLVVYDAHSSEQRDALPGINMLRKFANEGYTGSAYILRGGFKAFAAAFPHLIDRSLGRSQPSLSLRPGSGSEDSQPSVAPVIGGVVLPASNSKVNPFFSNIRQNQDLVDGVGQMDIAVPSALDKWELPLWLREAAATPDHGKLVSDKFLQIELAEQSRMRAAYSIIKPADPAKLTLEHDKVQLCGIEKGGKNRYKDILPFEHARVRLHGRADGACDYVNASYVSPSRSHKRYIASQGPLPATYEDFWSVVWDHDIRVIVMLTAESEGGQLKCHPYWQGQDFGPMKLRLLSEKKISLDMDHHRPASGVFTVSNPGSVSYQPSHQKSFSWNPTQSQINRCRANTATMKGDHAGDTPIAATDGHAAGVPGISEPPYVVIRKFALSHATHSIASTREITQLHYPSWPDFGAPAQPSHLLALVELANIMQHAAQPVSAAAVNAKSSSGTIREVSSSRSPSMIVSSAMRAAAATMDPLGRWMDAPEASAESRPMLVHCSAGCGRTGTFCTVDSVVDMLKRQRHEASQRTKRRIDAREKRVAVMNERAVSEVAAQKRRRHMDQDGDVTMSTDEGLFDDLKQTGDDERGEIESPLATNQKSLPHGDEMNVLVSPLALGGLAGATHRRFDANSSSADGLVRSPIQIDSNNQNGCSDESEETEDEKGIETSWLGDESVDLIAATVEDFRTQRLSMVQSLRQFVLCYETVIEWIWRLQQKRSGGVHGHFTEI